MSLYNPNYTDGFLDEQVKWFEERMEKLPRSMQINDFTNTSDLPKTVQVLINTLKSNKPSVSFSGYMHTLSQIRQKLEEQGL